MTEEQKVAEQLVKENEFSVKDPNQIEIFVHRLALNGKLPTVNPSKVIQFIELILLREHKNDKDSKK